MVETHSCCFWFILCEQVAVLGLTRYLDVPIPSLSRNFPPVRLLADVGTDTLSMGHALNGASCFADIADDIS